jgi:Double zinc ribbon
MVCSSCGTEIRSGKRFCSRCGAPLEIQCPNCGATCQIGDAFCGDCGVALEEIREGGALDEALGFARTGLREQIMAGELREAAYELAIEAALRLGDQSEMSELEDYVSGLPPVRAKPVLRAGRARLAAERAHRRGDVAAAEGFEREAAALLRSVGARPLLAHALLDQARRHEDKAALAEARTIYVELGASRWLARVDEMTGLAA